MITFTHYQNAPTLEVRTLFDPGGAMEFIHSHRPPNLGEPVPLIPTLPETHRLE